MGFEKQIDIIKAAKVRSDQPQFFSRIFSVISRKRKYPDEYIKACTEDYDEISRRIDGTLVQDSCSVRNILRTRQLATLLIDDKGELNTAVLPELIKELKENLYSLGPNRQYDGKRQEHILNVLQMLHTQKTLALLIKKISKPSAHRYAEQIIRDTLQLPSNTSITDAHARRAALAAWMTYLRQNVGSCFATAPAIIIHDEQPDKFLIDLNDLVNTGRLKRTFGGVEHSVPLSTSWGVGDLRKTFVLHRTLEHDSVEIWLSPSFIKALEAAGLIQKEDEVKNLVAKAIQHARSDYILISVEDLFKAILMNHLGITAKDLEDYNNRPRTMIISSLMLQVPKAATGMGGKGELCANYYSLIEIVSNVFKSFADNALLKAWEFTIASFSETKANFARWNLYSSLGLGAQEPGGIGQVIFQFLKAKVEENNAKVEELQTQYEQMYAQVKFLEGRIKQATESEIPWFKAEYQSKANEFYLLEEMRDRAHEKAKKYANLFDVLIDLYDSKFIEYFQEVYDADLHDIKLGPYDDSPAGFRLLYKHGRSNTSQWTSIKNANEFIEALTSFFTATEHEITSDSRLKGLDEEISNLVTEIVTHLKTQDFIETAFYRMAHAHKMPIIKDPLENLDKIEKKPWSYTSGGTMGTLVSCYFRRDEKPSEVGRWVENETELATFIAESVKQIPYKMTKEFLEQPSRSLLMHSPTHAFLLKPGFTPFNQIWENDQFTYTWMRDSMVLPMQKFVESISLDQEMMGYLIEKLLTAIPLNYQHHFKNVFEKHLTGQMTTKGFRDEILHILSLDSGFRGSVLQPEKIDELLFSLLPLFPFHQYKNNIENIFKQIATISSSQREQMLDIFEIISETSSPHLVNSLELKEMCLTLIALLKLTKTSSLDYHLLIAQASQKLGLALPTPLIFADTNWSKDFFGFTVNPGTERFELWKMDYTGSVGQPMFAWKQWLDGSRKDISWGIYNRPHEYR